MGHAGKTTPQHTTAALFHSFTTRLKIQFTTERLLALWVAPDCFCIAEFVVRQSVPMRCAWHVTCQASGRSDLQRELRRIVDRRFLHGMTVAVALATPDMFACGCDSNDTTPIEQQNLLPPSLRWDDVEHAVTPSEPCLFACMRNDDVNNWTELLAECGLQAAAMVPSGSLWSRLFASAPDVVCKLSSGDLVQKHAAGKWVTALFCPRPGQGDRIGCSFGAPVASAYAWCPPEAIPALEALLLQREWPAFTLNPLTFQAVSAQAVNRTARKCVRGAVLALAGVAAVMLLVLCGAVLVETLLRQDTQARARANRISLLRKENAILRSRVESHARLLGRKSAVAQRLYSIGSATGDSLWFSEIRAVTGEAATYTVIGHALSEGAIARFLKTVEGMPSVGQVNLEYTEKLSAQQTARLTSGKRRVELYRYKVAMKVDR